MRAGVVWEWQERGGPEGTLEPGQSDGANGAGAGRAPADCRMSRRKAIYGISRLAKSPPRKMEMFSSGT